MTKKAKQEDETLETRLKRLEEILARMESDEVALEEALRLFEEGVGHVRTHYQELVAVEDRIVLAGEHASYVGCWMEGALLSSIDAITRLHKRALEA
jgi:exodeoxyribonuclease VII small subunit